MSSVIEGEGITKMCNLDYWVSNRSCFFFYGSRLNLEKLKDSLLRTVKKIPILSSVIKSTVSGDGEKNHYFQHIFPSNVSFEVKEVDDECYEYYDVKRSMKEAGIISQKCYDEGYKLGQLVEKVEAHPNPRSKDVIENVPMMKVMVMFTKTSNKTILSFSQNHATSDLHSSAMFMNCWMRESECVIKEPFEISRNHVNIKCSFEEFDESEHDEILTNKYRPHLPIKQEGYDSTLFQQLEEGKGGSYKIIKFTRNRCEELKKLVKAEEGVRFSSFDCISAHLWKLFALRVGNDNDDIIPLMILVNLRNRHKDIGRNYFGNAVLVPSLELTKGEILKSSYTDLVMSIRKLTSSVNEKDLDFFLKMWKGGHSQTRANTLYINDWRAFDLVDLDFGGHKDNNCERVKCERRVICPPDTPNIRVVHSYTLLRIFDEDGSISVGAGFANSFLEKVGYKTDLSSPKLIQELIDGEN